MAARQRELGTRRMVEGRIAPDRGCVTQRTILREARIRMVWILGTIVIRQMAGHTTLIQSVIDTALMACAARNCCVAACKSELRCR
jgi:hypothetical protein